MSSSQIKKNVIFPYSVLYIQLDTNTGKDGESSTHLFKRTMIKMPKMDVMPIFTSEYPYFTKNVKYPRSLESADWKTRYEFFFNRQVFLTNLNKEIDNDESNFIKPIKTKDEDSGKEYYESLQEIEKDNVMITLRCLFPIPEVFGKALKNTYDHILTSNSNERVFKDVNVLSAFNIFGFMYKFGIVKKEKHEYFINIGGKRYMVDNVIWENDMVNHPVYKKFLLAQRNVYEEVENNKFNIEQRKEAAEEELTNILNKKPDASGDKSNETLIQDTVKGPINDKFRIANGIAGIFETDEKDGIVIKTDPKIDLIELLTKEDAKLKKDSKEKLKDYIANKLSEVDTFFLYLKNGKNEKPEYYMKIDEFIKKVNSKIGSIPESKKNEDKDTDSSKKQSYKELLKVVYEFIDYFDNAELITTQINSAKYKDFVKRNKQKSETQKKPKTTKSKNLFDKPLIDSFNNRAASNLKEYEKSGQSFQLQQFTNAVRTIEKLLKDIFSDSNTPLKQAEQLISIQEEITQYGKQSKSEQPEKVFFESSEIPYFKQLIKTAIQVKAANIVYDFVENNTPMNLSNSAGDGKNGISDSMKEVNEYITNNYTTEVRINNKLSSNTTNIYEPIRKTSNRELYDVIRLFKVGEKVLRAKNRSLTDEKVEKYKQVINDIYEEYVLEIKAEDDDIYNTYLYVGTDDVNINETPDSANPNEASGEIKRNVKEIYVQFDLVDADTFEKTSRAPCKLYDKELAQEFLYLADPTNKNNRSLSRFRNLDFNSVIADPLVGAVDTNAAITQPTEKKGGYTRRIRSANGVRTLRINLRR